MVALGENFYTTRGRLSRPRRCVSVHGAHRIGGPSPAAHQGRVVSCLRLRSVGMRLHAFYGDLEMVLDLKSLRINQNAVCERGGRMARAWARARQRELMAGALCVGEVGRLLSPRRSSCRFIGRQKTSPLNAGLCITRCVDQMPNRPDGNQRARKPVQCVRAESFFPSKSGPQ